MRSANASAEPSTRSTAAAAAFRTGAAVREERFGRGARRLLEVRAAIGRI